MKRVISISLFALLACAGVSAQVAKQVEVTKNYAPSVSQATKLAIAPNMVDTVTLRPEIDYTITPRSFSSTLGTHRFKPASVTYWEYMKEYSFYMKLGVGYPLNSVADVYASTHRADVGYIMGYVNHRGQYSKIRMTDLFDGSSYRNNSQQMVNRVGVNAGKYFGRYTLSGDIYYQSDIYHRYPLRSDYDRREINFEDVNLKLRFGDSFVDLKRLNFDVYGSVDFYNDKSKTFVEDSKYQQIDATAGVKFARRLATRSMFSASIDYRGYYGLKDLSSYSNNILSATLLYGYNSGRLLDLKAGLTYSFDHTTSAAKTNRNYVMPYLYVGLNVRNKGTFVPYIELDGEVINNSCYSLLKRNPYVEILGSDGAGMPDFMHSLPNTAKYNVRFGVSGHTRNSKFAYRFYANMSFLENSIYWYNVNQLFFNAEVARENVWSVNAELDYKPVSQLLLSMQVRGLIYTNFSTVNSAHPPVEAKLRLRYTHKKFAIGASAELQGVSKWTCINNPVFVGRSDEENAALERDTVTVPASVDVGLTFDWYVSDKCTVFVEGNNLANMNIYRWVYYREYGANFTAGVKVQF
ncbi:MAG: hypothetical protein J6J75_04610 [Alistipes sp.]|nr:hypothetical protein [Alistipes sp.]